MDISIDIKKMIVGIQRGLQTTKNEIYSRKTLTDNRKHMEKWDDIGTGIKNQFSDEDHISFIPLDRGLFKPVMIFDSNTKILYTIVKKQNYRRLLNRKSIQKAHYIDAMFDYNLSLQQSPQQLSLAECDALFTDYAELQINDLKHNIEMVLSEHEIRKYITIVINFNGYTLTEVRTVVCSKWLEECDSQDWSEYITPSYEEAGFVKGTVVEEDNIKAKISIKPIPGKDYA